MSKLLLCKTGDIDENAAKGFSVSKHGDQQDIFVVKRDGQFYAYRNQCPHTGVELNWQPDQFMDIEHFYIQCAVHGALFQVEDGLCVRGPCVHQHLQHVKIYEKNGKVFLS